MFTTDISTCNLQPTRHDRRRLKLKCCWGRKVAPRPLYANDGPHGVHINHRIASEISIDPHRLDFNDVR
jgi:hypothetical protein